MEPRASNNDLTSFFIDYIENCRFYRNHAMEMDERGDYDLAQGYCKIALGWLEKIQPRNVDYYREVAQVYLTLGDMHFNNDKYFDAAVAYNNGAHHLADISKLNRSLKDKDYRAIIKLFINLSDACLHLDNRIPADEAFSNAIKAFNFIVKKTPEEIIVAGEKDNYASFRAFYENQVSEPRYLKSQMYNINRNLLQKKHEVNQLMGMFDSIEITSATQHTRELDALMRKRSITPQLPFTHIPVQKTVSDEERRSMIHDLVSIAQTNFNPQKIQETLISLERAISIYTDIQMKMESDNTLYHSLMLQVQQLTNQIQQQNMQASKAVGPSMIGMYGRQNLAQTNSDNSMQLDEKPYDDMWHMGFG
jgi:hypothetical protein